MDDLLDCDGRGEFALSGDRGDVEDAREADLFGDSIQGPAVDPRAGIGAISILRCLLSFDRTM